MPRSSSGAKQSAPQQYNAYNAWPGANWLTAILHTTQPSYTAHNGCLLCCTNVVYGGWCGKEYKGLWCSNSESVLNLYNTFANLLSPKKRKNRYEWIVSVWVSVGLCSWSMYKVEYWVWKGPEHSHWFPGVEYLLMLSRVTPLCGGAQLQYNSISLVPDFESVCCFLVLCVILNLVCLVPSISRFPCARDLCVIRLHLINRHFCVSLIMYSVVCKKKWLYLEIYLYHCIRASLCFDDVQKSETISSRVGSGKILLYFQNHYIYHWNIMLLFAYISLHLLFVLHTLL